MKDLDTLLQRLAGSLTLAALLAGCGGGGSATDPSSPTFYPEPEEEWELVWSDEFDGDSLDLGNWGIQEGDGAAEGIPGWGNNELQWYSADNLTVADGNLTISARQEAVESYGYTSGRIRTYQKFEFTYGRVEASVKAAPGQGLWSAFWMMPTDSPYATWAASGELDIMEVINADTENERVYGTAHYGFSWPLSQQSVGPATPVEDPSGDFHVYALEWSGNELRWYVDGVNYQTLDRDGWYTYYYAGREIGYQVGAGAAPFDVDFHLLLNLAVGGALPGEVGDGAIPADMVVDYVRVYSCTAEDPNGAGAGCNSNADRGLEPGVSVAPFTDSFEFYGDAAGTLPGRDGEDRELAVNSFWNNDGALTFAEVAADDTSRGTVIDVQTTNMGNISISAVDGEPTTLFGMGNNPNFRELHAAELKFDLYVDSTATDAESSLLIRMDSGYPAVGSYALDVADLPADEWTSVSVPLNDLLAYREESLNPLDTNEVVSFFVLQPTGAAHVQVDNIRLSCGHPGDGGCGIRAPGGDGGIDLGGPPRWEGTWRVKSEASSLRVGPTPGDGSWWAIDDAGVSARACYFDDDYVFNPDGTFSNVLGDETWLEAWQGVPDEQCGAPVSPHDGNVEATWSYDEDAGTLLLDGFGAYVGLPKAVNEGELPGVAVPTSVTYNATFADAANATVTIEAGGGVWWTFELVKTVDAGPAPGATTLPGTWRMAPEAGSLGVGPVPGDVGWFSIDEAGLETRACYFDDDYVVGMDGSFRNVLGDETWLEGWQGVADDQCGTPVAPHDGSADATWTLDEDAGTLTLDGFGAYFGLPKAVNEGELPGVSVPTSVTYNVTFDGADTLLMNIESGGGVWWNYKLVKVAEPSPVEGTWRMAPEAGSLGVGPVPGDIGWFAIDEAGLDTRACYFDDKYVFSGSGSFSNVLDDETWLEAWQGVADDQCGPPVSPHDGPTGATWSYDEEAGTLVIDGYGAYVGLPKAVNEGELPGVSVPTSVTYNVEFENTNTMNVSIEAGPGVWWQYTLVRD